ncbi:MAG: 1-acyl-sn-glycerol-3-phosphate acyltransferase [Oligoflexus sp.]|nr:1-acyl-sn-glycerol-3-phosphate acyltransferase [Oligoflexus sp.]
MNLPRILGRLSQLALIFISLGLTLGFFLPLFHCVLRLLRQQRDDRRADRIVQNHLRAMCRAMGLRIHLRGSVLPEIPFLMLANHLSYIDILALGSLVPMGFMAKREVRAWPIIGSLARMGTAVFVERESVAGRVRGLRDSVKILQKHSLCIFPEGTTTGRIRPDPKRWHRGNVFLSRHAARATVCVGLHYANHAKLAWIDDQMLLPHLLKTLSYPRLDLYIEAQSLESRPALPLKEMSQLAHKTICRLADAAAERAHYSAAIRYLPVRMPQQEGSLLRHLR